MRTFVLGTEEVLTVTITTTDGTVLNTQPIAFSLDRVNWTAAEWQGLADTTRSASLTVDDDFLERAQQGQLYIKLGATIRSAGNVKII